MAKMTKEDKELLKKCFEEYRNSDIEYKTLMAKAKEKKRERDQLSSKSLADKWEISMEYMQRLRREWGQGFI